MNIPANRIFSIMVAVSQNGVIATKQGKLPFDIPSDKKYYLNTIKNKIWIQARKSFENGPSAQLETKHNFVLTHQSDFKTEIKNTTVVSSLQEALEKADEKTLDQEEIFIGGGMSLYSEALGFASKIYLTRVHQDYSDGGAFFPSFDWTGWKQIKNELNKNPAGPDFSFQVFERDI